MAGRLARGGRRRCCARARGARPRRARSSSPTRSRRPSSSTRSCTTRVLARRARGRRARRACAGKDVTPFLLDFFHRETGGREPRGQRAARAAQRRAGRARSPPPRRDASSSLGDVMVDVVAALPGPLARGSDTPARDRAPPAAARARTSRRGWRAPAADVALRRPRRRRRAGPRRVAALAAAASTSRVERRPRARRPARCIVLVEPRRRAHDAPRPRAPTTRSQLPATARAGDAPARRRATRCCATARAPAALARARARARERGMTISVDPSLGGAAGRGPGSRVLAARRPAAAQRRRGARADGRGDPTRGARARARAPRGRGQARRRRRAVDRRRATCARRPAGRPRSSTPPAPATRSPPAARGAPRPAPSRREALGGGCAWRPRAVAQVGRPQRVARSAVASTSISTQVTSSRPEPNTAAGPRLRLTASQSSNRESYPMPEAVIVDAIRTPDRARGQGIAEGRPRGRPRRRAAEGAGRAQPRGRLLARPSTS